MPDVMDCLGGACTPPSSRADWDLSAKVAHVEMGGWGGMHIDPLLPPISVPIESKTLSSETLNELSIVVCQVGDRGKI